MPIITLVKILKLPSNNVLVFFTRATSIAGRKHFIGCSGSGTGLLRDSIE